jgi:hypothetical protein
MNEDEIVSIEEIDDIETMDIEVDGDHLFMANDILTHNSGYDHKDNLSVTQMGESIKKVEHADFVALIRSQKETDNEHFISTEGGTMMIYIGKNRSGPKEKTAKLSTKFAQFRLDDISRTDQFEFTTNPIDDIMGGDAII